MMGLRPRATSHGRAVVDDGYRTDWDVVLAIVIRSGGSDEPRVVDFGSRGGGAHANRTHRAVAKSVA